MVDQSRTVKCPYCQNRLSYRLVRVRCPYCDNTMVFSLPEYAFHDGLIGCETLPQEESSENWRLL